MPTSLRVGPYRFFFYAGDRNDPAHAHVQRDDAEAKFWLGPVRLAWNHGFSGPELRRVERIATENENRLMEIWNECFDIGQ
ncbi:MAG: DUF4160 domain-containing protein [Verrucomicrobiia bacterium]